MGIGIAFDITPRCNLACAFCYNAWRHGGTAPLELDAAATSQLIARLLDEVTPDWFCFCGGEPLLRDDLERLVENIKNKSPGTKVGISTNGTLLDQARSRSLLAAGVDYIELPLLAANTAAYVQLTGVPGIPLSTVLRHAAWLWEAGGRLTMGTVVMKPNREMASDIVELAWAIGAEVLHLTDLIPTPATRCQGFDIGHLELHRFLAKASRTSQERRFPVFAPAGMRDRRQPAEDYVGLTFTQDCDDNLWVIASDGTVRTCQRSPVVIGSLQTQSFKDLQRQCHHCRNSIDPFSFPKNVAECNSAIPGG